MSQNYYIIFLHACLKVKVKVEEHRSLYSEHDSEYCASKNLVSVFFVYKAKIDSHWVCGLNYN